MEKIGIKTALVVGLSALLLSSVQAAVPERLIPGGDTIGLDLELDGVSVVEIANDLSDKGGLRAGDLICKVGGVEISSAEELRQAIQTSEGKLLEIAVMRNGAEKRLKLSPLQTAEGWKLGVYVRDRLKGIGTVTYYEEDANGNDVKKTARVQGVYVEYGAELVFRQVAILYSGDDFIICNENPASGVLLNGTTVSLYDKVVIEGRDLFDGKIIM